MRCVAATCLFAPWLPATPAVSLAAQEPPPIQDNSFLIEEAYNQEPGVVQHIANLSVADGGERIFRNGLQVVPGVAYTVDLSPGTGDDAIFLYLSLEHPY